MYYVFTAELITMILLFETLTAGLPELPLRHFAECPWIVLCNPKTRHHFIRQHGVKAALEPVWLLYVVFIWIFS